MSNNFTINGVLIAAANYDEHKKQYEFYTVSGQLEATIESKRIKLPKDNEKAWQILANTFGD